MLADGVARGARHGDKKRKVDALYLTGLDGRRVCTTDLDARAGYRTATATQPGRTFVGYHLHLATAIRSFTWTGDPERGTLGDAVPPYILGLATLPGNSHAGEAAVGLLEQLLPQFPSLRETAVDRGYSMSVPERFHWPVRNLGLNLVMDYSAHQRRFVDNTVVTPRRGRSHGTPVVVNCGTVFHQWLPTSLRDLGALPTDEEGRAKAVARYEERARHWRWGVKERRANGDTRFTCPFCAGRIRTDLASCARTPEGIHHVPLPDSDATSCCNGTITIGPEELGHLYQPVPYGTGAWLQSYGRRAIAETANSLLKNGFSNLRRGFVKVMGQAKTGFMVGMLCVAVNIQLTDTADLKPNRHSRRGRGGRQRLERTLAQLDRERVRRGMATSADPPGDPPGDPPSDAPTSG